MQELIHTSIDALHHRPTKELLDPPGRVYRNGFDHGRIGGAHGKPANHVTRSDISARVDTRRWQADGQQLAGDYESDVRPSQYPACILKSRVSCTADPVATTLAAMNLWYTNVQRRETS